MPDKLVAPWTGREVELLNDYQNRGEMHPYTCPNDHGDDLSHVVLEATREGWVCPMTGCEYTQNWAHWGSIRR